MHLGLLTEAAQLSQPTDLVHELLQTDNGKLLIIFGIILLFVAYLMQRNIGKAIDLQVKATELYNAQLAELRRQSRFLRRIWKSSEAAREQSRDIHAAVTAVLPTLILDTGKKSVEELLSAMKLEFKANDEVIQGLIIAIEQIKSDTDRKLNLVLDLLKSIKQGNDKESPDHAS